MSSESVIASVTAVLKHLLENGLINRGITASIGSDVAVSALPPDRVAVGSEERAQLNLFFYQATPNTSLRSLGRAAHENGEKAAPVPPLGLDLHYLITAYGAQDFHNEILLGYTLDLLHESPTLTRDTVLPMLTSLSSSDSGKSAVAALAVPHLVERIEEIAIRPQFLSTEELSRLWSVMQARFRPSAAYKVSVVVHHGRD